MEINLLPEEQVEKIKMKCLSGKITGLILLAIVLNGAFGFYLYSLKSELTWQLTQEEAKKSTLALKEEVKDLERFEREVKESFDLLEKAKRIEKEKEGDLGWFLILKELQDMWEPGITVTGFLVAEEEKVVAKAEPKEEEVKAEAGTEVKEEAKTEKAPEEVTYKVTLTGKAETRDQVILLKERLVQSSFYREVISPVSNLTSRENVEFDFTLKLK